MRIDATCVKLRHDRSDPLLALEGLARHATYQREVAIYRPDHPAEH